MKTTASRALKRGLLLYWSLWCTVVFATEALAGLAALGVIGKGELPLFNSSHLVYARAAGEKGAWRVGVIAWEGAAAVAFWLAFRGFRGRRPISPRALATPFTLALILYATFAIVDKLFLNLSSESTHLRILAALTASLMVIWLLPE